MEGGGGGVTVRWSGQLSVKDDFLVARSARQAGHERGAGGFFSGLFGGNEEEEEEEWEVVGDGGKSPSPSTGPPAEE